jgi:hypothetical protein
MSYRLLRHIDKQSLSNFAEGDFFSRNRPVSASSIEKDISSHTVFELSGVKDDKQNWVAYYNTTTQRSAVWLLKNKYRSATIGHYLAGWVELSVEVMDEFTSSADAGSLKIEQYLATTLPYWFWEEKIASSAICEKQNRALRKATMLATRESIANFILSLFSACGTLAIVICCTAFWLATLRVIDR